MKLLEFKGNDVEVLMLGGKAHFNPYDVGGCLDLSKSAVRHHLIKMNDSQVVKVTNRDLKDIEFRKLNNAGHNFLTEEGVKVLVSRCNKPRAKIFAKRLGFAVVTSKEQDTLETVINSIKGIVEYQTQYVVGGYRIDLYLPKLKIAIECDEFGHRDRDIDEEIKRQKFIENYLDCKFIRFNPDKETFNIGNVLNRIIREMV